MVAIGGAGDPVRFLGCAPVYKIPQTKWTARLTVQITVYVAFIGLSMAAGALMPWLLEMFYGWKADGSHSLYKMYSEDQGYLYENSNAYAFCPKTARYSYDPLQRGYPAPPLAPKGARLYDAWYHKKVVLRGVSWFGFNNKQGMVDGLWAGGSSASTDFQAVVYELKLLGFNTIRLPFTFDTLKKKGLNQVQKCSSSTKSSWAKRATDPELSPQPEYAGVPDPAVFLDVPATSKHLCNTYLPMNNTASIDRLLWTIQYFVASGFYVVLDYHPDPADTFAYDVESFARAWMYTWAAVTCLPNYASDIRGRILLELLNEPDKIGAGGMGWSRFGDVPGLDELYLTTMDTVESITPSDALFMLQGSVLSRPTEAGRSNNIGLSAGDGFVTDTATMSKFDLTDPRTFFNELLKRPYKNRVLLAPHLYGPSVSGVPAAAAFEVAARVDNSWGVLATDGYCNGNECIRLPVVAGEMGSHLSTEADLSYYDAIAQYTQLGMQGDGSESPLAGWIWWAYNANSNGTGGLTTDNWQDLLWPKLRYLIDYYGLNPWYQNPEAFVKNLEAEKADALLARATADAAAASAAAAVKVSAVNNLTSLTVVKFGSKSDKGSTAGDAAATDVGVDAAASAGKQLEVPAVVEYVPAEPADGGITAAPAAAVPVAAPAVMPAELQDMQVPAVVEELPAAPDTVKEPISTPAVQTPPVAVAPVAEAAASAAGMPAAVEQPALQPAMPTPAPVAQRGPIPTTAPATPEAAAVASTDWLPSTAGSTQDRLAAAGRLGRPRNMMESEAGHTSGVELDAGAVAQHQMTASDEAAVRAALAAAAASRLVLDDSQLPAVPYMTDLMQLGHPVQQQGAGASAAEKAAAAEAQTQATVEIAAATRLLLEGGNGASGISNAAVKQ